MLSLSKQKENKRKEKRKMLTKPLYKLERKHSKAILGKAEETNSFLNAQKLTF